jgi:branched-subunit amino acid transport protein
VSGTLWALIGLGAVMSAALRVAGPVAMGGRRLPVAVERVIALMAPALLAALVVTQALADDDELVVGPDTVGVACAGLIFLRGGSVLLGVGVAVAVTAGLRALT